VRLVVTGTEKISMSFGGWPDSRCVDDRDTLDDRFDEVRSVAKVNQTERLEYVEALRVGHTTGLQSG
jgi:hypothetical protein